MNSMVFFSLYFIRMTRRQGGGQAPPRLGDLVNGFSEAPNICKFQEHLFGQILDPPDPSKKGDII